MNRLRLSLRAALVITGLAILLAACAPAAHLIAAPTFRLVEQGSGLIRLDPPGIGSGEAVFRLNLDVTNPNALALRLAGLEGSMFLNERRMADVRFSGPIELPASGTGRLALEVSAPVMGAPQLLSDLAGLIAGASTSYQLDAVATIVILGTQQRLPSATLVRGEWATPISIVPPRLSLDPTASGLRQLTEGLAHLELAIDIANPNLIGFAMSAPALDLSLSGRPVAAVSLDTTPVPAFGTSRTVLQVEVDLASLGAFLAGQIGVVAAGGGALEIALSGPLVLEVPGITSLPIAGAQLLRGTLR